MLVLDLAEPRALPVMQGEPADFPFCWEICGLDVENPLVSWGHLEMHLDDMSMSSTP